MTIELCNNKLAYVLRQNVYGMAQYIHNPIIATASSNQRQMCVYQSIRRPTTHNQRYNRGNIIQIRSRQNIDANYKSNTLKLTITSHRTTTQPSCARPVVNHQGTDIHGRRLSLDNTG